MFELGYENFTKYDERDLVEILDPLDELKRALKDHNVNIYEELNFVSKRIIQSVLSGKRNVKRKGDEVLLSAKWEFYFGKVLDRKKVLLSKREQAALAIEKLFLSIYRLLEENREYGSRLIEIAIERAKEYKLEEHLEQLRVLQVEFQQD